MKKSDLVIYVVTALLLANLGWGCAVSEKRPQPYKKRSSTTKPVYEDAGVQVYRQENGTVVFNRNTGVKKTFQNCNSVRRIVDKPVGTAPLAGIAIQEGIRLENDKTILIIELNPEFKILSVYPHPHSNKDKIFINKDTNTLYLYKNGDLFKTYPVATGKVPNYTPEGDFKIANKITDNEDVLKPQLGRRWMGLCVPMEKDNRLRSEQDLRAPEGSKYGIHGTDEAESIGKYASGGCIRVGETDILELFDLVEVGTPVEIRSSVGTEGRKTRGDDK